jgi:hypothetical protein
MHFTTPRWCVDPVCAGDSLSADDKHNPAESAYLAVFNMKWENPRRKKKKDKAHAAWMAMAMHFCFVKHRRTQFPAFAALHGHAPPFPPPVCSDRWGKCMDVPFWSSKWRV